MARYQDIDVQMAELDIELEENGNFEFEEDVVEVTDKFELCLVGRFLTEKNLNIRAMKTRLADIWKPAMGINIKEIETGIFLFQFFHEKDLQWVMEGGPWSFDNAMLIIQRILPGEQPLKVPLWNLRIWIQINDLPSGFMSEQVGKQLGNFFGEFLEYDSKNNSSVWREYMRVRIQFDVRKPLKRKKKINKRDGSEFVVTCRYERLGEFCFVCGMVTHTDRFCRRNLGNKESTVVKEWGSWLRAPPRKTAAQGRSKWLREEEDQGWEERIGRDNCQAGLAGFSNSKKGSEEDKDRNRGKSLVVVNAKNISSDILNSKNIQAGSGVFNSNQSGLDQDELSGLKIEERKRPRREVESSGLIVTGTGLETTISGNTDMELILSSSDCMTSSLSNLAQSAKQTSQSK